MLVHASWNPVITSHTHSPNRCGSSKSLSGLGHGFLGQLSLPTHIPRLNLVHEERHCQPYSVALVALETRDQEPSAFTFRPASHPVSPSTATASQPAPVSVLSEADAASNSGDAADVAMEDRQEKVLTATDNLDMDWNFTNPEFDFWMPGDVETRSTDIDQVMAEAGGTGLTSWGDIRRNAIHSQKPSVFHLQIISLDTSENMSSNAHSGVFHWRERHLEDPKIRQMDNMYQHRSKSLEQDMGQPTLNQ